MKTSQFKIHIISLLFSQVAFGQTVKNYDVRSLNTYWMKSNVTCNFHVKKMNVDYAWLTNGSYEDFLNSALASYTDNYSTDDFVTATDYTKSLYDIGSFEAKALVSVAYVSASAIIQMIQSDNIGYRSYSVYCPAPGIYKITVSLVGDIDKPRNRVFIGGPEGTIQLDDDNPSSNVTKTYTCRLTSGAHQITVALGKGSSSVFHNAGTLNGVLFDNDTYVDWRDQVALGVAGFKTTTVMPLVGNAYHSSAVFNIPASGNFSNILDGTITADLGTIVTSGSYSYVDVKVYVNVKNCYGEVVSLPARFLNADAQYPSIPSYYIFGNSIVLGADLLRKPDITLNGTYETCSSY